MTTTIEELWRELRRAGGVPLYRRVAADHPLELYAVVAPPGRPGLMVLGPVEPPRPRPLRTVAIDRGLRPDGRWWLQVVLERPELEAEFTALCRDVVAFTRTGVSAEGAAAAVLKRIERWRTLLEGGRATLDAAAQRGLAAELVVLEREVMPELPAFDAICAWTGPEGTPQDFMLPHGLRLEVKAARPTARSARINGLDQLDPGPDKLDLVVVRLADAPAEAADSFSVAGQIGRLRDALAAEPAALGELESRLGALGWRDDPEVPLVYLRIAGIERHTVDESFPRLTRAMVPAGVEDADYVIVLPGMGGQGSPEGVS
jgi:hypothetical protein